MHEIAKHEFLSWVDTLEMEKLTEHEITLLSILIDNFEDIASVRTASGRRASLSYMFEKINVFFRHVKEMISDLRDIDKVMLNEIRMESGKDAAEVWERHLQRVKEG